MSRNPDFDTLWALAHSSPQLHATSGTHRGGWSRVCRPQAGEILKYQLNYVRRDWRSLGRLVPTLLCEARALREVRKRGFTALPEVRALAGDRRKHPEGPRAILVMSELTDREPVDHLIARFRAGELPQRQWHTLARACGAIIRQLHDAGFAHCSLRAEHMLARPSETAEYGWDIALIDFEHCRRSPRIYSFWRDLRKLARDPACRDLTQSQKLRFYLGYTGEDQLTRRDRFWLRRLAHKLGKKRRRKKKIMVHTA